MEYFQVEFENEHPRDTWKYIASKINWDVENLCDRISEEKINEIARTTNLSECKIFRRGKYLIVEHNDIIHEYERNNKCFLQQALELMELEKPAEWKTIEKLNSFRLALVKLVFKTINDIKTL